jgi:hypothetical protein
MKLVGDAVREGQFLAQEGNKMSRGLKLIGLCNWGYVKNNHVLINPEPNVPHQCRYYFKRVGLIIYFQVFLWFHHFGWTPYGGHLEKKLKQD